LVVFHRYTSVVRAIATLAAYDLYKDKAMIKPWQTWLHGDQFFVVLLHV